VDRIKNHNSNLLNKSDLIGRTDQFVVGKVLAVSVSQTHCIIKI
jgi:hypothetical protein